MTNIDIINKYPDLFRPYQGNPGGVNWLDVPKGWMELVDNLCESINNYCKNNKVEVLVTTMKEKFGTLRFYISGGDDKIDGMIWFAESLSEKICQECGEKALGQTTGWVRTLCEKCSKRYKDFLKFEDMED